MNTIKVIDNKIKKDVKDIKIEVQNEDDLLNVKKIVLTPLKDTSLEIETNSKIDKADIEINVLENIHFNLFIIRHDKDIKIKYRYNLAKNSTLNITKFYDVESVRELDKIYLNGEYANISYTLKTIANDRQVYDLYLYHHAKNTISNVVNNGVNIKGSIDFNVEGTVLSGIKECELNQNNRIITFTDELCKIEPKFIIDENDVVANHSALIGKFSEEELFYLKSRGIKESEAINLMVKGFLLSNIEDKRLDKIIEKYWR